MLSFGRSPWMAPYCPTGSLLAQGVSFRLWVPAGCRARFLSRHGISDAAGSLISPRLQPARYVFAMGFRLAPNTLKPCENLAEYRIRLFLPHILRRTPLLVATGETARRIPKRFLREATDVARASHLRSLIATTNSVLFARIDDVMMRRSVFWQVTCFSFRGTKEHAGSSLADRER
jgi:hypothetical protein